MATVATEGKVRTLVTELGGVRGGTDDGESWGCHKGSRSGFGSHFEECFMRLLGRS